MYILISAHAFRVEKQKRYWKYSSFLIVFVIVGMGMEMEMEMMGMEMMGMKKKVGVWVKVVAMIFELEE